MDIKSFIESLNFRHKYPKLAERMHRLTLPPEDPFEPSRAAQNWSKFEYFDSAGTAGGVWTATSSDDMVLNVEQHSNKALSDIDNTKNRADGISDKCDKT